MNFSFTHNSLPTGSAVEFTHNSLLTGSAVVARWRDGRYYPGHVVCLGKRAASYMVAFEDGDVAQTCHLITFDLIRAGDDIFAQTSDGWNAPAVVQGRYDESESQGYLVKFDTGDEARLVGHLD